MAVDNYFKFGSRIKKRSQNIKIVYNEFIPWSITNFTSLSVFYLFCTVLGCYVIGEALLCYCHCLWDYFSVQIPLHTSPVPGWLLDGRVWCGPYYLSCFHALVNLWMWSPILLHACVRLRIYFADSGRGRGRGRALLLGKSKAPVCSAEWIYSKREFIPAEWAGCYCVIGWTWRKWIRCGGLTSYSSSINLQGS